MELTIAFILIWAMLAPSDVGEWLASVMSWYDHFRPAADKKVEAWVEKRNRKMKH